MDSGGSRTASPVLGLVLAAGGSTRMGRPKQLAELDGRPLLAHVLAAVDAAPVDRVVSATYGGRPGHPRLFDRSLLPDLLRLTGDTGARDLLATHPDRVHRVEVGDLGSDSDIDVEADLERVGHLLTTTNRRKP